MEFNYFTPKEQEEIARKKHKNSHKNYDNQEISDKLSSADSCGDTENKNDSGMDDDNMEFINVLDESEETDSDEDDKEESVFSKIDSRGISRKAVIVVIIIIAIIAAIVIMPMVIHQKYVWEREASSDAAVSNESLEESMREAESAAQASKDAEESAKASESKAEEAKQETLHHNQEISASWDMIEADMSSPMTGDLQGADIVDYGTGKIQVDSRITSALDSIISGAKDAWYNLKVTVGYRSYKDQKVLFDKKVSSLVASGLSQDDAQKKASETVSEPGTSDHQTGLGVHLISSGYEKASAEKYAKTDCYKWLVQNASKYGFILRYPEGKEDITGAAFEPWHFRYVGKENAEAMDKQGLCLEEYIKELKGN